jgi:hypothetical protein
MLSTYLNTLRSRDLWLDRVAEPLPAADWDPAHDAGRKPLYLVASAIKVPAMPGLSAPGGAHVS